MKKFLNSFSFVFKAMFLILLLLVGWAFVNVANLIKGKKSAEHGDKTGNLFGSDQAKADVSSCAPKGASTPFLSYYDGNDYKLENDFMFGRPKSYWYTYAEGKAMYEDGRISPDLYKIAAPIKSYNDKLLFQIQEIELEESFFKWLELRRVVHPKGTEVIVDSEYKKFYVVDAARFSKKIILPEKILAQSGADLASNIAGHNWLADAKPANGGGIRFEGNDSITLTFKNLKNGKIPHLIVKSWFRDWVLGLEENWLPEKQKTLKQYFSIFQPAFVKKVAMASIAVLASWLLHQKSGGSSAAIMPFIIGSGTMCDGWNPWCSFVYEYKDVDGQYNSFAISEPRAWRYNTEIIELPRESVLSGGTAEVRIRSSKRHMLGFIGLSQEIGNLETNYREEKLKLASAKHDRLNRDFARDLAVKNSSDYVHTIPGDKVNLEFEAPKIVLGENEKETYLIKASGFYTSLRPESRRLAGNWQEKVSGEAKTRLASLKPLKNYN